MVCLLNYDEACQFLGLKRGTMYALVSQRRIPHVRLGRRLVRFSKAELERWVAERSINSPEKGDLRRAD